ncbi:MAG: Gfo/Idh/MocA family oxidoreductase [Lactobacillus iners]|nr:Gfo/Idh/MocA family oxidoreductase [Lactobacillus iners]
MNKFVKIGLVGYGRHMDHSMFPNIISNENTEVVSVADISQDRLDLISHKIRGIKTYTGAEDLIKAAKKDHLNAVVISMAPQDHLKYTKLALENGLHVFVEKPVCLYADDLNPLIKIADKNNLVTCVGTKWRYTKATQLAQNLCRTKTHYFPKVITLEAEFPGLFKDSMWGLNSKTEITFYDMFVHAFDYIESWVPNGKLVSVKKVFESESIEVIQAEIRNSETVACINLIRGSQQYGMQFEATLDNGAKLSMHNLTSLKLIDSQSWLGTEGSLRDEPGLTWNQGRLYRGYARAGYREEWDAFISAILNKKDTPTNLKEAKKAIEKINLSLEKLKNE